MKNKKGPVTDLRTAFTEIEKALTDLGASRSEIVAFRAGASLMGHLRTTGSRWRVAAALHYLETVHPIDVPLELWGREPNVTEWGRDGVAGGGFECPHPFPRLGGE